MYCVTGNRNFQLSTPSSAAATAAITSVEDVVLIRQIRSLLYEHGFTIGGARLRIEGETTKQEQTPYKQLIDQTISELEAVLSMLDKP